MSLDKLFFACLLILSFSCSEEKDNLNNIIKSSKHLLDSEIMRKFKNHHIINDKKNYNMDSAYLKSIGYTIANDISFKYFYATEDSICILSGNSDDVIYNKYNFEEAKVDYDDTSITISNEDKIISSYAETYNIERNQAKEKLYKNLKDFIKMDILSIQNVPLSGFLAPSIRIDTSIVFYYIEQADSLTIYSNSLKEIKDSWYYQLYEYD